MYTLLRTTRRGELVFYVVNDAFWVAPCEGGYRAYSSSDATVYTTPEAVCDAQAAMVKANLAGRPEPIGYCHYCGQGIYRNADAIAVPLDLGGLACRECR